MRFHPAYPTATDLSREHNAALRDLEDLQTLDALKRIVASAIERAAQFDRIHSPTGTGARRIRKARSWFED
jgi:hypothetical protein